LSRAAQRIGLRAEEHCPVAPRGELALRPRLTTHHDQIHHDVERRAGEGSSVMLACTGAISGRRS
jgi:hypothetical protein